jgi:hypothetical protein
MPTAPGSPCRRRPRQRRSKTGPPPTSKDDLSSWLVKLLGPVQRPSRGSNRPRYRPLHRGPPPLPSRVSSSPRQPPGRRRSSGSQSAPRRSAPRRGGSTGRATARAHKSAGTGSFGPDSPAASRPACVSGLPGGTAGSVAGTARGDGAAPGKVPARNPTHFSLRDRRPGSPWIASRPFAHAAAAGQRRVAPASPPARRRDRASSRPNPSI